MLAVLTAVSVFVVSAVAAADCHMRIETDHGAVHIWEPSHHDCEIAGVVVYGSSLSPLFGLANAATTGRRSSIWEHSNEVAAASV